MCLPCVSCPCSSACAFKPASRHLLSQTVYPESIQRTSHALLYCLDYKAVDFTAWISDLILSAGFIPPFGLNAGMDTLNQPFDLPNLTF